MFSQIKDTKDIRRDFQSVAWVMPQRWNFRGAGGAQGGKKKFFKHGHVAYLIDRDYQQNSMRYVDHGNVIIHCTSHLKLASCV